MIMFLLLIKLQTTPKRKAIPINHKKKIIMWKRRFLLRKYYLIKKIKILSEMYQKNKIIKSQKLKVRKSEMSLIRSKKKID
jgi:hypothetical protein